MGYFTWFAKNYPAREHVVIHWMGNYAALWAAFKINSSSSAATAKAAPVLAAAAPVEVVAAGTHKYGFETPTMDTFDKWAEKPENWKNFESFVSDPSRFQKWVDNIGK
jgi:hypothetical protein